MGASGLRGIAKHAFLSEDGGPIIDLNTLIPAGSDLTLTAAIYINDRGEIAGFGLSPNGDEHAQCGSAATVIIPALKAVITIRQI